MEAKDALKKQYHAALAMLKQVIKACPEEVWLAGDPPRQFWRIAYHALYYTDWYVQTTRASFTPWERHVEDIAVLWAPPASEDFYTKKEVLQYWAKVDSELDGAIDRMDLESSSSGFPLYKMSKFEHQLANLRHLQQHVGQLSERLAMAGIDPGWVGGFRDG